MKMNKPTIMLLFVVLTISLLATAAGVPNPAQKGPYEVGYTNFITTDGSRNPEIGGRPIAIYLWYPVDAASVNELTPRASYPLDPFDISLPSIQSEDYESLGLDRAYLEPPASSRRPFALVVLSPGWGCTAWDYTYIGTRLASHGFVVAVLSHYADCSWSCPPWDPLTIASLNRPRDVSFALTELLARNETGGNLLYGLIRPDKVAASGHSLGGYAAMTLAAGDDDICDTMYDLGETPPPEVCGTATPKDPRIKVIVPLDGSTQILRFSELARIKTPTLGMGQEWSMLAASMPPPWETWQARLHAAVQAHPAYRADLKNSHHLSFLNMCESIPILGKMGFFSPEYVDLLLQVYCTNWIPSSDAHRTVTEYMIAFLKTHLMGEPGYQQILTPGWALTQEQYIEFFVTEKRNAKAVDEDWPGDFLYFMHQPGSAQARGPKDPATKLPVQHLRIRQ